MDSDEAHLDLLKVFHYVLAGLQALFGCFPLIHLTLGVLMLTAPEKLGLVRQPPQFLGWFLVGFALVLISGTWTLAVLSLMAGRRLGRRRSYTFCLVVATLLCLAMPLGTVLGVFSIVVLVRPSVKARFS